MSDDSIAGDMVVLQKGKDACWQNTYPKLNISPTANPGGCNVIVRESWNFHETLRIDQRVVAEWVWGLTSPRCLDKSQLGASSAVLCQLFVLAS